MQGDKIKNAPDSSVGADKEHSLLKDELIISDMSSFEDLDTKTAAEIMDICYPPRTPIVPGLIFPGTSILVGPPKIGKSFLLLQVAYHISRGMELWGRPVRQGTVLYLALEDDEQRLQRRMNDMFGTDSTNRLYFATESYCIGEGLEKQIRRFLVAHPDTVLVIIDVLQNVRKSDSKSYAEDYDFISALKRISDWRNLGIIIVHHTRKEESSDPLQLVSGTNGLAGAADTTYVLTKKDRMENEVEMIISGRDTSDVKAHLVLDRDTTLWQLRDIEQEPWKKNADPLLERIDKEVVADNDYWIGSATDILRELPGLDMKPNVISRKLNANVGDLLYSFNIRMRSDRTSRERRIEFTREKPITTKNDDYDDYDDVSDSRVDSEISSYCDDNAEQLQVSQIPSLSSLSSQQQETQEYGG